MPILPTPGSDDNIWGTELNTWLQVSMNADGTIQPSAITAGGAVNAIVGGTNVSVVEVLAPGEARIRSWERGVEGETLCCGTGCAVAAAWLAAEGGPSEWTLHPTGGEAVTLSIGALEGGRWRDLWLCGPVHLLGTRHRDVPPSQGIHS